MENLLKEFCSIDQERSNILRPWLRHGVIRATNGHILIHVPEHLVPGHSIEPNDLAPDSDKVLNGPLLSTDSYPLDEALLDEIIASKQSVFAVDKERLCRDCDGDGRTLCRECQDGTIQCHSCGGTGKIKFNSLDNEPPHFSRQAVEYFGKKLNWNYLKLISRVIKTFGGDWRIAPGKNIGDGYGHAPMVFRNTDGVKIALMEIRP